MASHQSLWASWAERLSAVWHILVSLASDFFSHLRKLVSTATCRFYFWKIEREFSLAYELLGQHIAASVSSDIPLKHLIRKSALQSDTSIVNLLARIEALQEKLHEMKVDQ